MGLAESLLHIYPALDFFSKNLELGYQTLRDVLTGLVLLSLLQLFANPGP